MSTIDPQDVDLKNNEEIDPSQPTEPQAPKEDEGEIDWQARAKELEGRLKRAETKLKKSSDSPASSKSSTPGDFDYSQKAFLAVNEVKTTKEIELAKEFMANTGKSLDDVVTNKYFLQELKELKELEATAAATPSGSKRTGQSAQDSVEYWLAKGEMPPQGMTELRREYVNAKMKKEGSAKMFYNQ